MIARRTRLLSRTFFGRMFENEVFSSSVSASNAVMWLLAALATPGVMVSGSQYYFYAHARTFTPEIQDRILFVSQTFHVDFAMAIAGVMTMLIWTSLGPDRRDALVLGPLPVAVGEQARARMLALLRFFALFAVAVSVPTAVVFTFVTVGDGSVSQVPARIGAHVLSTLAAGAFVFFALIDLQLLLAATMGPRAVAAATWPLQAGAVLAMVAAVTWTGRLADALLAPGVDLPSWIAWNPAAWFVGLYRTLAGDGREVFGLLGARAALAAAASAGVALVLYPLAYRRSLERAIATEGRRHSWWSGALGRVWLRAMSPLLRTPLERGIAAFAIANFTRSQTHRFLIGSYIAIGLLFALPQLPRLFEANTSTQFAWFSVPLGLLCWMTAGLRVAMMLPIEPASNWIFKITEPVDKTRVVAAAVSVIQGLATIPVSIIFGAAAGIASGPLFGALVCAVSIATGSILTELLTLTMRAVPGTCTYRPGQLRLRVLWPVYLLIWSTATYVLPRMAVNAYSSGAASLAAVLGSLAIIATLLRAWRITRARTLARFVYDEAESQPSVFASPIALQGSRF